MIKMKIGPLRPAPAHSQVSLRDGFFFRFRGGIKMKMKMNLNTKDREFLNLNLAP